LGNLLFDWQPKQAVAYWEQSRTLDPSFAIVHRNLALAYARQENALDKGIASLERAIALGGKYPIHFFELDDMYEAAGVAPEKRLALLEKHHASVSSRDDALAREIGLKVFAGKHDEAIHLMSGRRFNVWEGGARFSVHDSWTDAHLLRGHRHFAAKRHSEALSDYQKALEFPEGLQTARHRTGGRFPEVAYWIGVAQEALGKGQDAKRTWQEIAEAQVGSGADDILATADTAVLRAYQALALAKLGRKAEADAVFNKLIASAKTSLNGTEKADFFAKFGEGQTARQRTAQAHFVSGLGYLGLGETNNARAELKRALETRPDHLGAKDALARLQ
jgi:tetratricopeptide (TPR) repeat protein